MEEKNDIINNEEKSAHKQHRHHSSHHGSHHKSHHSSHHGSRRGGHRDSQRKVVSNTYKKVKFKKIYKPLLSMAWFFIIIIIFIALVWALFNPSTEVREAVERNKHVTENVSAEVRIKEMEAEIEALNDEIAEFKKKISELEGRLASETVSAE